VHLFAPPIFEAIWRWFDAHAWSVRYRLQAQQVIDFQLSRGVDHLVALQYAHKPGMARGMNVWMAALVADQPRVTGLATVLPGEPEVAAILAEGFAAGLRGVKLHCHVQCFAPDDDSLGEVYEACIAADVPLVMHCGREPKSPAYDCDPHEICGASRTARVLRDFPRLKLCVPHLGADEFSAYEDLLERHEDLWLDTTMMLADYFATSGAWRLLDARPDRLLYGTDFPNLPYPWDRELHRIGAHRLDDDALAGLLHGNARRLFGLPDHDAEASWA
jgi:predicted TIM-barrel fold metal-dependent hydrolase